MIRHVTFGYLICWWALVYIYEKKNDEFWRHEIVRNSGKTERLWRTMQGLLGETSATEIGVHTADDFATFFTQTWLRYVRVFAVAISSVVCRLSVVCNVGAPYSGGWTFRQYFFTAVYLAILWPPWKILGRSSQGNHSAGSVKRKKGIKLERFWTYRRLYLINATR